MITQGLKLMAVANGAGDVRVYRYPVQSKNAQYVDVAKGGHADAVTKVRFTSDDKRMITLGGVDRTVMQWRVVPIKSGEKRRKSVVAGGDDEAAAGMTGLGESKEAGGKRAAR